MHEKLNRIESALIGGLIGVIGLGLIGQNIITMKEQKNIAQRIVAAEKTEDLNGDGIDDFLVKSADGFSVRALGQVDNDGVVSYDLDKARRYISAQRDASPMYKAFVDDFYAHRSENQVINLDDRYSLVITGKSKPSSLEFLEPDVSHRGEFTKNDEELTKLN